MSFPGIPGLVDKTLLLAPPDWSFDVLSGQYRFNLTGELLTPDQLRTSVEGVIDGAKEIAEHLTESLHKGHTNLKQWTTAMIGLIAALHQMASAAATGGIPGLLDDAAKDLRATLAKQNSYLAGFVRDLRAHTGLLGVLAIAEMSLVYLTLRAQSYMDAALITFERQRYLTMVFLGYQRARRVMNPAAEHCPGCLEQHERSWVPIQELKLPGLEECGQWCKCNVEYSRSVVEV